MEGGESVATRSYDDAYLRGIRNELRRIRQGLERIERALPGCNQEGFREDVKEAVISLLTSERTHLEYK